MLLLVQLILAPLISLALKLFQPPALRRRPLVILGQLPLVSEVFQLLLPVIILLARLPLVQSLLRHLLHLPNLLMRSIKTLLLLVFLDSLGLTKLHSCFLRALILLWQVICRNRRRPKVYLASWVATPTFRNLQRNLDSFLRLFEYGICRKPIHPSNFCSLKEEVNDCSSSSWRHRMVACLQ